MLGRPNGDWIDLGGDEAELTVNALVESPNQVGARN
jgi:hypothetical protein